MTQSKFKAGDKVKTAGGLAGEIVQVNTAGTAALVHAGAGKEFESSWYAIASLTKPGAKKKDEPTESGYLVTFKTADDVTYTVAVEKAADEAAAIAAAQADGSHTEGDEVAGVEQVA